MHSDGIIQSIDGKTKIEADVKNLRFRKFSLKNICVCCRCCFCCCLALNTIGSGTKVFCSLIAFLHLTKAYKAVGDCGPFYKFDEWKTSNRRGLVTNEKKEKNPTTTKRLSQQTPMATAHNFNVWHTTIRENVYTCTFSMWLWRQFFFLCIQNTNMPFTREMFDQITFTNYLHGRRFVSLTIS